VSKLGINLNREKVNNRFRRKKNDLFFKIMIFLFTKPCKFHPVQNYQIFKFYEKK